MEIVGIYTDTVEFIGNASPSGPSPEINWIIKLVCKSYILPVFLNISTMLAEEKSTVIVLEHFNSDNWDHDPANPRRWSLTKKWLSMGTVCDFLPFVSCFITPPPTRSRSMSLFCPLQLPWWPLPYLSLQGNMVRQFYSGCVKLMLNVPPDITNSSILAMTLSISFLSLGLFPLIIAPLSEMYGRKWVNLVFSGLSLFCWGWY